MIGQGDRLHILYATRRRQAVQVRQHVSLLVQTNCLLTATRMIQPTLLGVPLIQITQNSIPIAPSRAPTRRANCIHRTHWTLTFVFGLIGFQLRLPYGLFPRLVKLGLMDLSSRQHVHNEIRVRMSVELSCIDKRTITFRSLYWCSQACLRDCLWVEAFIRWAHKRILRRVVV